MKDSKAIRKIILEEWREFKQEESDIAATLFLAALQTRFISWHQNQLAIAVQDKKDVEELSKELKENLFVGNNEPKNSHKD
jgi:hypothetical protein